MLLTAQDQPTVSADLVELHVKPDPVKIYMTHQVEPAAAEQTELSRRRLLSRRHREQSHLM